MRRLTGQDQQQDGGAAEVSDDEVSSNSNAGESFMQAAQAAQQAPVWTPNASSKECKVHLPRRASLMHLSIPPYSHSDPLHSVHALSVRFLQHKSTSHSKAQ